MKVRVVGFTLPSPASSLIKVISTLSVGKVFKLTVKVAVPPASVVVKPETGFTLIAGVSGGVLLPGIAKPCMNPSIINCDTSLAQAPVHAAGL